jgi:hypothetical protein
VGVGVGIGNYTISSLGMDPDVNGDNRGYKKIKYPVII